LPNKGSLRSKEAVEEHYASTGIIARVLTGVDLTAEFCETCLDQRKPTFGLAAHRIDPPFFSRPLRRASLRAIVTQARLRQNAIVLSATPKLRGSGPSSAATVSGASARARSLLSNRNSNGNSGSNSSARGGVNMPPDSKLGRVGSSLSSRTGTDYSSRGLRARSRGRRLRAQAQQRHLG